MIEMDEFMNTDYFITVGTLIAFERKERYRKTKDPKEKLKWKQSVFCEGICNVTTYRKMEKQLEIRSTHYVRFLERLGLEMKYDSSRYHKINILLLNLEDAIEKYDVLSVFTITKSIDDLVEKVSDDIYCVYLKKIVHMIYDYYHENKFPTSDDIYLMKEINAGYPSYIRDIMIDLMYKYYRITIVDSNEFLNKIQDFQIEKSSFIPNQINYLLLLADKEEFNNFYNMAKKMSNDINNRSNYLRLLDIDDITLSVDYATRPTEIKEKVEESEIVVNKISSKYKCENDELMTRLSLSEKRKIAQHYQLVGTLFFRLKDYESAIKYLPKAYEYCELFEIYPKIMLFNCYDRLNLPYTDDLLSLKSIFEKDNRYRKVYEYYIFKDSHKEEYRKLLKYINDEILDYLLPEDEILGHIFKYELNFLAKKTKNYCQLQVYLEKMGYLE